MAKASEAVKTVNKIESAVYKALKPYGFTRHGRNLCRFTGPERDICQIVNFQMGQSYRDESHEMYVNTAIYIPECFERNFVKPVELKEYYSDAYGSIRSAIGKIDGGNTTRCFNTSTENIDAMKEEVLSVLMNLAIPAFEVLNTRESILLHRRDYPYMDTSPLRQILLDETMIYGRLGDIENARRCFEEHYQNSLEKYEHDMKYGRKEKISSGGSILYFGREYTIADADEDGYVTIYGASHGHLDYLDDLAVENGLR